MKRIMALALVLMLAVSMMGIGLAEENPEEQAQYMTEFERPMESNDIAMFLFRYSQLTTIFNDGNPPSGSQMEYKAFPIRMGFEMHNKITDAWGVISFPRTGKIESIMYALFLDSSDESIGDNLHDPLAHKDAVMCFLYALLKSDNLDDDAFLAWCQENADADYERILNSGEENPISWGDHRIECVHLDYAISIRSTLQD